MTTVRVTKITSPSSIDAIEGDVISFDEPEVMLLNFDYLLFAYSDKDGGSVLRVKGLGRIYTTASLEDIDVYIKKQA